jgi:hypothetical protein
MCEYRCDERLKTQNEESTRLADTGLVVEQEHLKAKTRYGVVYYESRQRELKIRLINKRVGAMRD